MKKKLSSLGILIIIGIQSHAQDAFFNHFNTLGAYYNPSVSAHTKNSSFSIASQTDIAWSSEFYSVQIPLKKFSLQANYFNDHAGSGYNFHSFSIGASKKWGIKKAFLALGANLAANRRTIDYYQFNMINQGYRQINYTPLEKKIDHQLAIDLGASFKLGGLMLLASAKNLAFITSNEKYKIGVMLNTGLVYDYQLGAVKMTHGLTYTNQNTFSRLDAFTSARYRIIELGLGAQIIDGQIFPKWQAGLNIKRFKLSYCRLSRQSISENWNQHELVLTTSLGKKGSKFDLPLN